MTAKVWFVTGASRGFGRIWTEAALKRGDSVAATARNPEAVADLKAAYPDAVLPLALDVTDRDAVFAAVKAAAEHFGRIDVVLNNAGFGVLGAIEELDADAIRAQMETNFFGALWVMQAMAPMIREQNGGHILCVSSIGGLMAWPMAGIYQSSKFALEAASEAFQGEIAPFGGKVTILEPGVYATEWMPGATRSAENPAYDPARAARNELLKGMQAKDPQRTAQTVLDLVDMDNPPLRLMLGSVVLPMIRRVYDSRIAEWEAHQGMSAAAE